MRRGVLGFLIILGSLTFFVWSSVYQLARAAPLEVNFLAVGQGDSILIKTNGIEKILIDGGPGKKVLERLPPHLPFLLKKIDLVVLTHPDRDHIEGLLEVVEKYPVAKTATNSQKTNTLLQKEWEKKTKEKENLVLRAGDESKIRGNAIEVLWPKEIRKNPNENSLVLKVTRDNVSFLFTGDIHQKQEKSLEQVTSQVLQVAHHGSKTSSNPLFLKKVSPQIAVISCGEENQHGHPHPEVLEKLKETEAVILRTDKGKDVQILSDGKKLIIR